MAIEEVIQGVIQASGLSSKFILLHEYFGCNVPVCDSRGYNVRFYEFLESSI